MLAPFTRRLRRKLSAPASVSARKRARERQKAERTRAEGQRLARELRDQRLIKEIEQQRKPREEMASYEPWGRAGGGAPNPHCIRFTDLRAKGIYPEDELKGISYGLGHRWSSPRRHRRTPLRLREDPQLFFAEQLRRAVENDIRYKQTPYEQKAYKEILDDMVDKRKKAVKDDIQRNLEYERIMQTMDGPWGKPGPGGAIWRNPRNIGLNFSKSMGWTDNEIFDKLKGEHNLYKRSSLALPEVKRDDDIKYEDLVGKENEKSSSIEKLPDISKSYGDVNGNRVHTCKNQTHCNGKSKSGSVKKKEAKRLCNREQIDGIQVDELDASVTSTIEKKLTPEATIIRLTGGVELVPLLARRRRVGARTLPSSDVTRPPEQSCQWRELLDVDYLSHLKHQIRVKSEQKEESRRVSAESVRRHHATWSSLWGRPGHGAPQQRGRYARNNLARLLYVAPLTNI